MDAWDFNLRMASKSVEDRNVFQSWVDKSIVKKLEELANDVRYKKWAPTVVAAAREFFNDESLNNVLSAVAERAVAPCNGIPYISRIIQGYARGVQELICEVSTTACDVVIRVFGESVSHPPCLGTQPTYRNSSGYPNGLRYRNSEIITCMHILYANQHRAFLHNRGEEEYSFNRNELKWMATAITCSLPVHPRLLPTIKAELTADYCKLVLAGVDPLEEE